MYEKSKIYNQKSKIVAQTVMKNKTALKTLVLLGFKNDQRKFLENFGKLFLRPFFCNEWLDWLLIL
jgi:hypothetical protein